MDFMVALLLVWAGYQAFPLAGVALAAGDQLGAAVELVGVGLAVAAVLLAVAAVVLAVAVWAAEVVQKALRCQLAGAGKTALPSWCRLRCVYWFSLGCWLG